MDHAVARAAVTDRLDAIRADVGKDSSETEAALITRRLDIVDLVNHGAAVRHLARHFKIDMETVREDYAAGLAMLRDKSVDRSLQLREEITARQRELIYANMPAAKAGDVKAATIVQHADQTLASIWGLRSLRVDTPPRAGDPAIADALSAYLEGIGAAATT